MDKLKAAFGDSKDFQRALGLIYTDVLEFLQRVYKCFRRRAWHFYFMFDWGLFQRRFKSTLERLASHSELLEKEAAAIHYSDMRVLRDRHQLEMREIERVRDGKMALDVLAWLSAAEDSQEDYLHQLADHRQLGTCNWILEHDQVNLWTEDEGADAILWMTGIPGSGKSFLCSLLIDHLQTRKSLTTAYYFCGQNACNNSCVNLLRTVAIQVLRQNMDLAPLVHQAYLEKGSSRSSQGMKKMLREMFSNIASIRLILDGIDECDRPLQHEILKTLVDLQKATGGSCRLLISSRREPQINKELPRKIEFPLNGRNTEALQLYIQKSVEDLFGDLEDTLPGLRARLFGRVSERLREGAKGMFLWVRLVISMLRHQESELAFEGSIEKLPDGLEQAYGRILESITRDLDRGSKDRAFRVLYWACASYRPITIHEITDGIALKPGQTVLSRQTRTHNADRYILELCAPLLVKSAGGIVDLVHFSAKEYLLDMHSGPFIDTSLAHFNIAFSCVTNLTAASKVVPRFHEGATESDLEALVIQGSYGLHNYSHQFWAEHVRAFFSTVSALDEHARPLIEALEALCIVLKRQCEIGMNCDTINTSSNAAQGLQKLMKFPRLHSLMTTWLLFRSKLDEMVPTLGNIENQEEWKHQKDETFLSLINFRLREITDRLLNLDPSELPSHIDKDDYASFISRFHFDCRYYMCAHHCDSLQDRNAHEATHMPSFPCLHCDFSGRGFRSRRDLDRHTKQYHMSAEDFEVPNSLNAAVDNSLTMIGTTGPFNSYPPRQDCWNQKGRKVLKGSFQQVLAKIKTSITPTSQDHVQMVGADVLELVPDGESCANIEARGKAIEKIEEKIDGGYYHTLADFKSDVHRAFTDHIANAASTITPEIDMVCDQEIQTAMMGYPALANFDSGCASAGTEVASRQPAETTGESSSAANIETIATTIPGIRAPYWSKAEEKEFPRLVGRCGHDYLKIADYLKSKTAEEVKSHFLHLLSNGQGDLTELAQAADARLQLEFNPTDENAEINSESSQSSALEGLEQVNACPIADTQLQSNELTTQPHTPILDFHPSDPGDPRVARSAVQMDGMDNRPKKYIRRRPDRAYCTSCSKYPEGLYNDEALFKHERRYHSSTREVWFCKDVSLDKKFLAKCRACANGKRYLAKSSAFKHLRTAHFQESTKRETLMRWMERREQWNPHYQNVASHTPPVRTAVNGLDRLQSVWKVINEQQESDVLVQNQSGNGSLKLNPIMTLSETANDAGSPYSASDQRSDSSQWPSVTPNERKPTELSDDLDDFLLQNVSFDQILPNNPAACDTSVQPTLDAVLQLTDRTLIRPDQVPRLHHLNTLRRLVCQDQVDALYVNLKEAPPGSERYEEAMEGLRSLSQTLMRDWRNWRRTATLASEVPFSI